jgi:hypothetical protein
MMNRLKCGVSLFQFSRKYRLGPFTAICIHIFEVPRYVNRINVQCHTRTISICPRIAGYRSSTADMCWVDVVGVCAQSPRSASGEWIASGWECLE